MGLCCGPGAETAGVEAERRTLLNPKPLRELRAGVANVRDKNVSRSKVERREESVQKQWLWQYGAGAKPGT